MSYDLSFSEEFFTDETAPYDTEPSNRPTNVYQAIISLDKKTVREIGRRVLKIPAKGVKYWLEGEGWAWDILATVRETNTCSNLNPPVVVWIDPKGQYTLKVYDKQAKEEATPLESASIRGDMKRYGLTRKQAEFFESLSREDARAVLGQIEKFREKNGWPDMLSPLVRGYWKEVLKDISRHTIYGY